MIKLIPMVALASLFAFGCAGAADAPAELGPQAKDSPHFADSCTVTEGADAQGREIWKFNGRLDSNPVPGGCEDEGDGFYLCTPAACLVLPYTGSCPHCPGGGE